MLAHSFLEDRHGSLSERAASHFSFRTLRVRQDIQKLRVSYAESDERLLLSFLSDRHGSLLARTASKFSFRTLRARQEIQTIVNSMLKTQPMKNIDIRSHRINAMLSLDIPIPGIEKTPQRDDC